MLRILRICTYSGEYQQLHAGLISPPEDQGRSQTASQVGAKEKSWKDILKSQCPSILMYKYNAIPQSNF